MDYQKIIDKYYPEDNDLRGSLSLTVGRWRIAAC